MSVKFNIGSWQDGTERPLLFKAGRSIEEFDTPDCRAGLIPYMILEQEITPAVIVPKHRGKSVEQLQEVIVRKLLRLGYDFGEQSQEANAFIEKIRQEDKQVKISINSDIPQPILQKASKKFMTAKYTCDSLSDESHKNGLIAYIILHQAWKPGGLNERYRKQELPAIQRAFVKRLVKLGYDFGWQENKEAIELILKLKGKVQYPGLVVGATPEPVKEKTYCQRRTVTVVLERKGFTHQQAIDADENFSGDDVIEDMKAAGFKVVSSEYSRAEGRTSTTGGVGYFGWKKDND